MSKYDVKFTREGTSPIEVPEGGMNTDFDISFPGRVRLEWGEEINEAFFNLLENFAALADPSDENMPDLDNTTNDKLSNPLQGQLWYNKTNGKLYNYTGTRWEPYTLSTQDYAANWGQVNHGEFLPNPITPDGYVFPYSECIWSVSPFQYPQRFRGIRCDTDLITSQVTMEYSFLNGNPTTAAANYLIIGIKGNVNNGRSDF